MEKISTEELVKQITQKEVGDYIIVNMQDFYGELFDRIKIDKELVFTGSGNILKYKNKYIVNHNYIRDNLGLLGKDYVLSLIRESIEKISKSDKKCFKSFDITGIEEDIDLEEIKSMCKENNISVSKKNLFGNCRLAIWK